MKIKQPSARAKPDTISIGTVSTCKPKKVYCNNCRYYNIAYYCIAPKNLKDTYAYKNRQVKKSARDINKKNNCSWYKREWFRFWEK